MLPQFGGVTPFVLKSADQMAARGRPALASREFARDLDEGAAFWLAAGEAQRIDLRAPLARPAAEIENAPPWLTSLGRIADPSLARPGSAAG